MESLENGWLAIEVAEIDNAIDAWAAGLKDSFTSLLISEINEESGEVSSAATRDLMPHPASRI